MNKQHSLSGDMCYCVVIVVVVVRWLTRKRGAVQIVVVWRVLPYVALVLVVEVSRAKTQYRVNVL